MEIVKCQKVLGVWKVISSPARDTTSVQQVIRGEQGREKSGIQDTLNLSTCGNSSTDTRRKNNQEKNQFHVSCVMCHVSPDPVTCHISLMPSATATDPPPDNLPTMDSRFVPENGQKDPKIYNRQNPFF